MADPVPLPHPKPLPAPELVDNPQNLPRNPTAYRWVLFYLTGQMPGAGGDP